jgi:hypothetical protein
MLTLWRHRANRILADPEALGDAGVKVLSCCPHEQV